jgi:hypothetical protein
VRDFFAADKPGFVNVPLAVLQDPGLAALMDEYKLSTRCMPFDDGGARVLIGKAY